MTSKDELPKEPKELIGTEIDLGWGADAVCQPVIRYWCEALEDDNRLYYDAEFCKANGYPNIIAPPTMAITLTRPAVRLRPGESSLPIHFTIPDLPEIVVQSTEWEFHTPIVVGDRLRAVVRLVSVSPAKTTRLGAGRFVAFQQLCYNQHDTLVATRTSTCFYYRRASPP